MIFPNVSECSCNRKRQATFPTCELALSGTSAVVVVHVSTLPVFELVSGLQTSLLSLLFQVTSQCPVYPDYASDTSDNALRFGSSFLPVLFCCTMRKPASPQLQPYHSPG